MTEHVKPFMVEIAKGQKGRYVEVVNEHVTVKLGRRVKRAHYDILVAVHSTGLVPCPTPIAFYDQDEDCKGIVMSTIRGIPLKDVLQTLTFDELLAITLELRRYMTDLQQNLPIALQHSSHPSFVYSIAYNGCWCFPRSGDFTSRPVPLTRFVNILSNNTIQYPNKIPEQRAMLSSLVKGDVQFCHMDLHPGNIMYDLEKHQITGILDWDICGWYTRTMEAYATMRMCKQSFGFARALLIAWEEDTRLLGAGTHARHTLCWHHGRALDSRKPVSTNSKKKRLHEARKERRDAEMRGTVNG